MRLAQEKVMSAIKPPRPARREEFMKTPWWFRIAMIAASLGSLILLGLLVWAAVEIVPALVGWLEAASA